MHHCNDRASLGLHRRGSAIHSHRFDKNSTVQTPDILNHLLGNIKPLAAVDLNVGFWYARVGIATQPVTLQCMRESLTMETPQGLLSC